MVRLVVLVAMVGVVVLVLLPVPLMLVGPQAAAATWATAGA